jgi:hypothetical protein
MEGSPEHSVAAWCNGDKYESVAKQISFEDVSKMDGKKVRLRTPSLHGATVIDTKVLQNRFL